MSDNPRVFTVSASSLATMQSCEFKYKLGHIEKLVPMQLEPALDFGGLVHWMLHPYYFSKIKPEYIKARHKASPLYPILNCTPSQVMEACIEMGRQKSLLTYLSPEERNRAIELFVNYVNIRAQRDNWHTIDVEQPFSKILHKEPSLIILWEGKVDVIVEIQNEGVHIVDHKTGGRDRHIAETNSQIVGSTWAFGVNRFIINKVLSVKDDPFRRETYYANPTQQREWVEDTIHYVKRMITLYIDQDYFPLNRNGCDAFGGCRYLRACKAPVEARNTMIEGLFKRSSFEGLYKPDPLLNAIAEKVLGSYASPETYAQVHSSSTEETLGK